MSDSESSFDSVQESLHRSHHPESRASSSQYSQEEIETDAEALSSSNAPSHIVIDRLPPVFQSGRRDPSVAWGLEFAAADSQQLYSSELAPGCEKKTKLLRTIIRLLTDPKKVLSQVFLHRSHCDFQSVYLLETCPKPTSHTVTRLLRTTKVHQIRQSLAAP